jgi:phosphopantothenoylcysteine decarboxylase/phosphopantothenate--cysteine ligase
MKKLIFNKGFLSGKRVLLGVSGGIAAYKTPLIIRELIKLNCKVKVVMTPSSKDFVTPLTLSTVSQNPVLSSFISEDHDNPLWNDHVKLANWPDLFLIAPATCNTISAMANGKCNNLLLATYFSSKAPVMIAPAMDLDMYKHPSNKMNINKLKTYGNYVLPVGDGFLASGLEGKGRMLETHKIIDKIINHFNSSLPLLNKKVLISAGPTYEAIDAVRFIGNFSSGKMGFALASIALSLGASVTLITGPTSEKISNANLNLINIISTNEMFNSLKLNYSDADIVISSAAVSDFRPIKTRVNKIKNKERLSSINIEPTIDILEYLGKTKNNQFLVGFALETDNEIENAIIKLKKKKLDAIVLNSLNDKGAGFSSDNNKITYISKNQTKIEFKLKPKIEVAQDIFNQILNEFI